MSDGRSTAVRGTVDGGGGTVSISPNGLPVVGLTISGTFVQTLAIEELIDGADPTAAQVFTAAGVAASATVSAPGRYLVASAGRSSIQVRQTAYTSGTAAIVMYATLGAVGGSGGGGGGGGAATIADGADVAQGATTDVAVQGDNAGTISAKLRGLNKSVAAGLPITAAALPLPTGAAADSSLSTLNTTLGTLTPTTDFDAKIGSLTETAPATDIASAGLNGRLQRVAQRITSFIALLPAALVGGRLDVNLGAAPAAVTLGAGAAAVGTVTVGGVTGTISTNNSSTATLTSGATFTGVGDDVSGYASLQVQIFADQVSAVGGFSVQYSQNNTNWDVVDVQTDLAASVGRAHFFKPRGRFFRIVFINGGVNQGAFRLQTIFHPAPVNAGAEVNRAQNTAGAEILASGATNKSCAYGSSPTAVTSGNFAQQCADVLGLPFIIGGSPAAITLRATFSAAQTDTALVTIASGNKIVVTSFMITVDNATSPNVSARVGFGTVNTPTTTGVLGSHPGIAPGSGFGRGNGGGIIGAGADDADLRFTCSVPTNGNVDVNVSYYVVPV